MTLCRLLDLFRSMVPLFRPKCEIARRFVGRVAWNGLEISKEELIHSIAFKSSRWIDLAGFEMLCGDYSFRIRYTVTKGQGVLGRLRMNGGSYIPVGDILQPSKLVKLGCKCRIEPEEWYSINVIISMHEYEMVLVTSGGSDGRTEIQTETGVRITFSTGLESCAKTGLTSGQIAGIAFYRLDSDEEEFLNRCSEANIDRSGTTINNASLGEPLCLDENTPDEAFQTNSMSSGQAKPSRALPPLGGIITPPVRTEEVLRAVFPYK